MIILGGKHDENIQNYWVLGLCPSSDILNTRKHNVSETGSVSILRRGRETPTLLDPLERFNLSHWMGILSRMVSREMYEMR
jgi:hypothetical protein